jgi:hypothetical protein
MKLKGGLNFDLFKKKICLNGVIMGRKRLKRLG